MANRREMVVARRTDIERLAITKMFRAGIRRLLRARREKIVDLAYRHLRPKSEKEALRYAKPIEKRHLPRVAVPIIKTDSAWLASMIKLLSTQLTAMAVGAAHESGQATMGALVAGGSDFFQEVFDADFLREHGLDLAVTVPEGLKPVLRKSLAETFLAKHDVAGIRKALKTELSHFEGWKLSRIARTEGNKAATIGALEAYDQSGVVEGKEWINADPDAPVCIQLVGVVVPLKEVFSSGWGTFEAPPAHPNCESGIAPITDLPTTAPRPRSKRASIAASKDKLKRKREAVETGQNVGDVKTKLPPQKLEKKPRRPARPPTEEKPEPGTRRNRTRKARPARKRINATRKRGDQ